MKNKLSKLTFPYYLKNRLVNIKHTYIGNKTD